MLIEVGLPKYPLGSPPERADASQAETGAPFPIHIAVAMLAIALGIVTVYSAIALARPPLPLLIALVAGASLLATIFGPASRSAVPAFVHDEDDLTPANAWIGTALNLQLVLGPLLGGSLVEAFGFRAALMTNAISFLASAGFLLQLPPLHPSKQTNGQARFLAEARAGLSFVRGHITARTVLTTLFLGVAFAALDNVALVFLIRDVLDGSAFSFGAVTSAYGIGMVAASIFLIRSRRRLSSAGYFLVGWLLSGIGTLLTGLAPVVGVALGMQALAGAGNGMENVRGRHAASADGPQGDAWQSVWTQLHGRSRRRDHRICGRRHHFGTHLGEGGLSDCGQRDARGVPPRLRHAPKGAAQLMDQYRNS